ncbi:MAG: PEP-CTERM sorting domain-containing protein [Thermoguttaceae bacterium]|jgi:hypothetical protein
MKRFDNRLLVGVMAVLLAHVGAGLLHAEMITLQDSDSAVVINPLSANLLSNWSIAGTNYLNQQGFWYLLGNSGLAQPLSALTFTSISLDTSEAGLHDGATLYYGTAGGLQATVKYSLLGGDPGSGSSNLAEQVKLSNSSANPMTVRLFQYTDADLSADDDTVTVTPSEALQSSSAAVLDSVVTGPLTGYEAGLTTISPTTLQRIETIAALTLNNATGPLVGDATWAYQWDATLQPNHSITLGQNNSLNLVPEPGSLSLLAGAAIALGVVCLRRRAAKA